MTVNHGGNLKPDYFRSYLSLVMDSRNCNLKQAENYMLKTFFKNNRNQYGSSTYGSFMAAINSLKKEDSKKG
ncbi:hypothetical protein [Planomicrobium sp. CPCC 101110]|uniref:hypothetical protein n=1 Tax=Planomicrobium sp. CPCC 101110 TaxID=2599619 RepID=UPI0011B3A8B2|nr:hypothetical protein [Planomicrobium sp. CPCC 101110]TWT26376.1 hypothetical protein FQV30_11385 [Planomicrobium sp. CPCC 101110]